MHVPWRGSSAVTGEGGNGHRVTSSRSRCGPAGSGRAARVERNVTFGRIGCHDAMLTEYIDEALRRARYELIEDEETPYYGEVPELPGVWASGRTLEGCRRELKEVVEGWILVSVRRSLDLPRLGSAEIREIDARAA